MVVDQVQSFNCYGYCCYYYHYFPEGVESYIKQLRMDITDGYCYYF